MNKSETQQLEWIIDLYSKVLDGGTLQVKDNNDEWIKPQGHPSLLSNKDRWRVIPEQKEIDMSVYVQSGIDCEFSQSFTTLSRKHIGKLHCIHDRKASYPYNNKTANTNYNQCRPRMNHVHAWQGGASPVPKGTLVKVYFPPELDSSEVTQPSMKGECSIFNWDHTGQADDIVAFEITGIHKDYRYSWDKESN